MLHFKDAPARVWQVGMMNGQKLMRFGIPELVEGNGCIGRLPEIIDEDGIRRVMIGLFAGSAAAMAFLIFNLLDSPCLAAISTLAREMNDRRWTAFALAYQNTFAYAVALMVYQFGGLVTGTVEPGAGTIAAAAVLMIMAVEEISKVDASHGVIVQTHNALCCWPIFTYGTEEQKRKFLPDLLSGKKLGAFGLTEPNAGTDAAGTQTKATDAGDHWIINGSKIFISGGGIADVYVIFAMADCDLIIEAVLEVIEIKEKAFAQLDAICKESTIFASNTSSISISKLASSVKKERKGQFIGTHFNSPASVMKLVEVVPGLLTEEETVTEVIDIMMKFCDPEEYDYPIYKKEIEAAGVPMLYLEVDQQLNSFEQIRTRIQSFNEMLI